MSATSLSCSFGAPDGSNASCNNFTSGVSLNAGDVITLRVNLNGSSSAFSQATFLASFQCQQGVTF